MDIVYREMRLVGVVFFFLLKTAFGQTVINYPVADSSCVFTSPEQWPSQCWDSIPEGALLAESGPYLDCSETDCSFFVIPYCETKSYSLFVVNRYGEVVFETTEADTVWDAFGLKEDTYFYLVKGVYTSGAPFRYHGRFMVWYDETINPEMKEEEKHPWFPTPLLKRKRYDGA